MTILDPAETAALLHAVPLAPWGLAGEIHELPAAAEGLGWPVVLKGLAPGLAHRTEWAAVRLGLRDEADLVDAGHEMVGFGYRDLEGFLVQAQVEAGPELLAGYLRDPVWGPVVLLGAGGIRAEGDPDAAIRLWPAYDLEAMLGELRSQRIFAGFRGWPAADPAEVARILETLGRIGASRTDIAAIDLNPVIVTRGGLVAVDAVVRVDGGPAPRRALPPLEARLAGVAPFFEAERIAVIGASRTRSKAGSVITRNLLRLGFTGEVIPIHPRLDEVEGLPCHPSLVAAGGADLAVAVTPRHTLLGVVEDCAAAGVGSLIVATAGYSDAGPEGQHLEQILLARARELGVRVMGPNSIGVCVPATGLATSIASLEPISRGAAAFVGQSGLLNSAHPRQLAAAGRGAWAFCSLGNKGDVDEADVVEWLAHRDEVEVVGAYLEGVGDGRRLVEVLADAGTRKPVVVLKGGRTELGQEAAASHTGALATDVRVTDAALRQAGVVQVADFEHLFDQAHAFEVLPLPAGPGVGVVSISGVGCVLAADAVGAHGLHLPALAPDTRLRAREVVPGWAPLRNPVDMWSTIEQLGPGPAYRHLAEAVLDDPGVHALVLIFIHIPESALDPIDVFADLRDRQPHKPVLGAVFGGEPALDQLAAGLEDLGIPTFRGPERAVEVVAGMWRYARWRRGGQVAAP